jgi:hypothetical protein
MNLMALCGLLRRKLEPNHSYSQLQPGSFHIDGQLMSAALLFEGPRRSPNAGPEINTIQDLDNNVMTL